MFNIIFIFDNLITTKPFVRLITKMFNRMYDIYSVYLHNKFE